MVIGKKSQMRISSSVSFISACIFSIATACGADAQSSGGGTVFGEQDGQTPQYQIYRIGFMQEAWNNNSKAIVFMHKRQYPQAIELLRGALKIDSNYADARTNLAIALNNHALDIAPTDNGRAIEMLREACKIKPENRMYRDNLQKALRREAKTKTPAENASSVAANTTGLNNKAVLFLNEGNTKDAELALREALRFDPTYRMGRKNLAIVLNMRAMDDFKNDREKKLELLREASALDPDNFRVAENLRSAESEK